MQKYFILYRPHENDYYQWSDSDTVQWTDNIYQSSFITEDQLPELLNRISEDILEVKTIYSNQK
jgi:hypothetical protein